MPLTFYGHPLSSYCWKVLIALYEAGLPFDFERVDLSDAEAAARYRMISPFGRMPALQDDGQGVTLSESTIILEHLAACYPSAGFLIPDNAADARTVRLWDRYFDFYVHTQMQKIVGDRLRPATDRDRFGTEQARVELRAAYRFFSERIADSGWACGPFSMADCAAAPSLYYANRVEPFHEDYPALAAYLERLMQRPSFARVLEEAAPFMASFPEEPAEPSA